VRLLLDDVVAVDGQAGAVPRRALLVGEPQDAVLRALAPGARLRARVRLREPMPLRNPGRPDREAALARSGIAALATLADPGLVVRMPERDRNRIAAQIHALRRRGADRLLALGPGGALLAALALGDRSGLTPAHEEAWARLGLSHLLSVSGLHLALVAGLAYAAALAVLRRSASLAARTDPRDVARGLAVLSALAYALAAGFGVPVRRSFVMVAAGALSLASARSGRAYHPLAAAALFVLALEPQALFEAGAQLSFVACAALSAAARRAPRSGTRPRAWLESLLRTTASASAATAPIAAWHALPAAPLALLANAVAVPWTGVALLPASLAAAVAALAPATPLLDRLLGATAALGAASLDAVTWASAGAFTPGGSAPSPGRLMLAAGLALAVCRSRRTSLRCAGAGLLAVLLAWAPPAALEPPPPRFVVLDVGAGDALLVQGRAASLLVDAGSALPGRFDRGRDAVLPALRALGVRRLDLVVASHADLDHRGGLPAVLAALPVGALWIPAGASADPGFADLRAAARAARVPVRERGRESAPVVLGDLRIVPLWPPASGVAARNERSLAVRVEVGAHRLLLLGDLGEAEGGLLERPAALRADVLVLPHHGSGGSSSSALLDAVRPGVAIVSAPCRGRLPHPAALARARGEGASLWWTGRDGALRVALGERLAVLPFASRRKGCEARGQRSTWSTSRS
jgi:competence protein ComEC